MVYSALSPVYPTLSRTTIYNTLKLFADSGLVQVIRIEDDRLRYDADTSPHLHFKCRKCGNVFDITDEETLRKINADCIALLPAGFSAERIQTNIWGLCSTCVQKQKSAS
jgi:Fe2+ or Zn2+ uptake regulation protein